MTKAKHLAVLLVLMGYSPIAFADRLVLIDGREFTGVVTEEAVVVSIKTANGTASFPWHEVASIERMPTPEALLAKRLAAAPKDDADALFAVGQWASVQGLTEQAEAIYRNALTIKPDHAGARKAMRQVRIAGRWQPFDAAMAVMATKINMTKLDSTVETTLAELLGMARTGKEMLAISELSARSLVRRQRFAEAAEAFKELAKASQAAQSSRAQALADILTDHPDGLYILKTAYPPAAVLLGRSKGVVPAGPASLADPRVLQAALADKARAYVDAGRKLLAKAYATEVTSPEAARTTYLLSLREFDRADVLVPNIARSCKIEITRRRVALIRKEAERLASRFDGELADLGKEDMTPQAYSLKITRMMRYLKAIVIEMDSALKLAQPYPKDLILEIRWAELHKEKILDMQDALRQELSDSR